MTVAPRRAFAVLLCAPLMACSANSPTTPSSQTARSGNQAAKPIVAVTSLTVGPCPTATITPGTTAQLTATANLEDGSSPDVTTESAWLSTGRGVADVDASGLVTALTPGLTIVTANFKGNRASCQFLVDAAPPVPPLPPPSGDGIVINEFRPRGPNGGDDEFIELRNDTSGAINVAGWRVGQSSKFGTMNETLAILPAGSVINPGCHFLLTRTTRQPTQGSPRGVLLSRTASLTNDVYSGPAPGDATFTVNLTDDSGFAVFRADGTVVDAVGMSLGTLYKEGVALLSFGSPSLDRSYQRVGDDSNNNVADFVMTTPSTPTNHAGPCSLDSR